MPDPSSSDRSLALIPLGLAGVCLLFAGIAFALVAKETAALRAAAAWPSTDGVVTRSAANAVDYRDAATGADLVRIDIDFAYAYEVAGHAYTGTRLDVTGATSDASIHVVDTHPVGAHVAVLYDPADPAHSGLTATGSGTRPVGVIVGLVMCVVAAPFLYGAYRMSRAPPDS